MGKLDGKVALVSGSSRGIGRSIALKLASEGAKVVGYSVHPGIVAHYVLNYGTEDQKRCWLPEVVLG